MPRPSLKRAVGKLVGAVDKKIHSGTWKAFSPEQQADYFKKYRTSVGLDGGVPGSNSFNSYDANRISSVEGFSAVKAPDGTKMNEKLKDNTLGTPAVAVKNSLTTALQKTTATETAKTEFNANLKALNDLVKKDPPNFNPGAIGSYLQEIKAKNLTFIKQQQQAEKDALTKLFNNDPDPNFVANLKTSMGLTDDAQVGKVKDDMLAALDKSHKDQTTKFEKELTDSTNKFFDIMRKEFDRIAFLGDRFERNKRMRENINKIAAARGTTDAPATASLNGRMARLKGIKVDDLEFIASVTGKQITKNADGSFSMPLNTVFGDERDLASLAQTVKACGHDSITMEIDHTNPEKAIEAGRKAYEACIEAGFDPKKIDIKVNGKLYRQEVKKGEGEPLTKLFGPNEKGENDQSSRLTIANEKAERITKEFKARVSNPTGADANALDKLKKEINDLRTAATTPPVTPPVGGPHPP